MSDSRGRPSKFDQALADTICERMAEGEESLRAICRDLSIPLSTVLDWAKSNKEFSVQYAHAREIGTDAAFERIGDIAAEPPPTVKGFSDAGWVSWQKNRIDAEKWILSKRAPKKYGDKLGIEHSGELALADRISKARVARDGSGG